MIYFDNAATTPMAPEVVEAMMPYLTDFYGNPSSTHAIGRKGRTAVEKARKSIAQQLNASSAEIFFTSGGTESNNMVLNAAIRDLGVTHIISSPIEHHCVLHTLEELQAQGIVNFSFVKLLANGHVDHQDLRTQLEEHSAKEGARVLVSLMHVNNEIGNLLNLQAVGELCKEFGAYFHSDTVQSIGYFPIDLQAINIHFISGAGHKLHGPKGVGFVYINGDLPVRPFMFGGAQERNMRAGTENVYGIVGLGKAVELAYEKLEADKAHITALKQKMLSLLKTEMPDIRINGDAEGASHYKILNVGLPLQYNASMLVIQLDIAGVCASGGSACSSGTDIGSHVISALAGETDEVTNVRFSFSRFNTMEEVEEVFEKLKGVLKL